MAQLTQPTNWGGRRRGGEIDGAGVPVIGAGACNLRCPHLPPAQQEQPLLLGSLPCPTLGTPQPRGSGRWEVGFPGWGQEPCWGRGLGSEHAQGVRAKGTVPPREGLGGEGRVNTRGWRWLLFQHQARDRTVRASWAKYLTSMSWSWVSFSRMGLTSVCSVLLSRMDPIFCRDLATLKRTLAMGSSAIYSTVGSMCLVVMSCPQTSDSTCRPGSGKGWLPRVLAPSDQDT